MTARPLRIVLSFAGRACHCRPRLRRGSSLPEVIIASMILSFIAVTVGALMLSSNLFSRENAVKYAISQEASKLRATLKNYVTADTTVLLNAPGDPPWHLPADSSCSDCWALAEGLHDVTQSLTPYLRENYGATLKYQVTVERSGSRDLRKVRILAAWTAPAQ